MSKARPGPSRYSIRFPVDMDRLEFSNYTVCAALAAPHLLYAYIWFFPRRWMALFGKNSCKTFETVAWLLKGESWATRSIDYD